MPPGSPTRSVIVTSGYPIGVRAALELHFQSCPLSIQASADELFAAREMTWRQACISNFGS
jgi:hypothetical protein